MIDLRLPSSSLSTSASHVGTLSALFSSFSASLMIITLFSPDVP